jgi:threonine aldolase
MFFASDNGAPVPAPVMAALARANEGPAMPYGHDPLSARVEQTIRDLFEAPGAAVFLVATGTAANALSLALLCPPWGTVFLHASAHAMTDECGAPEFFTGGAKLVGVPGEHGRMTPAALEAAIARVPAGSVHSMQRGAVSLTDVTEAGTVLAPDAIAGLAAVAHAAGLPVHLDGARLANALTATGATPAEITWKAGVDVLSFGGTKGGLMGAEAVVLFDPARAWELQLRRKRAGHLFSKHRYLAAQFDGWLEGGLWLDHARHANAMAARLSAGIAALPGGRLIHPTEANVVFAAFPRAAHDRAAAAGARYNPWSDRADPAPEGARLVTSWATTEAEVDGFLAVLRG